MRVFGARYGTPQAPEEKFTVFLLDDKRRRIAEFPFAYGRFERGEPEWVELEVPPTLVPSRFVVGVDFQPTARRGVFVHLDAVADGEFGVMVALRGTDIIRVPLSEGTDTLKLVSPEEYAEAAVFFG